MRALAERLREVTREDLRPTAGAEGQAAVAGLSWDLAAVRLRAVLDDVKMDLP